MYIDPKWNKDVLQTKLREEYDNHKALKNRVAALTGLSHYEIDEFTKLVHNGELTPEEREDDPSTEGAGVVLSTAQVRLVEQKFTEVRDLLKSLRVSKTPTEDDDADDNNIKALHDIEKRVLTRFYKPLIAETKRQLVKMFTDADAKGDALPSPMTPVRIYTWLAKRGGDDLSHAFSIIESQGECMEQVLKDAAANFRKNILVREKGEWARTVLTKRGIKEPTSAQLQEVENRYEAESEVA